MLLPILMEITLQVFPVVNSENDNVSKHAAAAPAMYVFDDSIFESGNNNLLQTLAKADFEPDGMSFDRGATGRFTNGRTVVDFIAEFLGLPYPSAYLSISRGTEFRARRKLRGLNFASGSCGEQAGIFERAVKHELSSYYGNSPDELSNYLAKSIFVISIGSNNYINKYMEKQRYDTSARHSPRSFARLLVQKLSQQLQRLHPTQEAPLSSS